VGPEIQRASEGCVHAVPSPGVAIRQDCSPEPHATVCVPGAVGAGSAAAAGAVRSDASSVPTQFRRSGALS